VVLAYIVLETQMDERVVRALGPNVMGYKELSHAHQVDAWLEFAGVDPLRYTVCENVGGFRLLVIRNHDGYFKGYAHDGSPVAGSAMRFDTLRGSVWTEDS
jgi:hypothetical protein